MQTEETISELHARLIEAKMRANNFSLKNLDLKQEVIQRDNTIKSLKSKEQRMEKQLELAEENKQMVCAELSTVNLTLRGKEQQVDRLNSEIRSLTKDLTLMRESKQEQDLEVSMLKTTVQQYEMKMKGKESVISAQKLENEILKTQLKAKEQRHRETLEQDNGIAQLTQVLDNYQLNSHEFLQNMRYCEDCHSTQQKLERIQRDYNRMIEENRELNDQLMFRAEENKRLENKIMKEATDCAQIIGLQKNEIELRTKALHQMLTNANPGTQKRQSEERSESQGKKQRSDDSNISARDLGNDRPPRKDGNSSDFDPGHHCCAETPCRPDTNSCRPDHATSYNDRTPDTMAKSSSRRTSTPVTTSQSRSPDFRTFAVVAEGARTIVGDSLKTIEQKSRINSAEGQADNSAEGEADDSAEDTDKADSIEPILIDLSDTRDGNDDSDAKEENDDSASDTSTESFLIPIKDYLVTKKSNASQNQTRQPHRPRK